MAGKKVIRKRKPGPASDFETFEKYDKRRTGTPKDRVKAFCEWHKKLKPDVPHILGIGDGSGNTYTLYRDDIEAILKEL